MTRDVCLKILGVVCLLAGITGCSHLTRPSAQHGLLDESMVVDALDHTAEQGSLVLTEQGLWALLDPKKVSPRRGELLLLTQPERPGAPPQLFAVVSTHDWGAMLQRISRSSFQPTPSYIISPIEPEMLTFEDHGAKLCLDKNACNTLPNQHLTYTFKNQDLLLTSELGPREDRYLLPIRPSWDMPEAPYLAVETGALDEHGFIASIDSRCDEAMITSLVLPTHIEVLRHEPPSRQLSEHPLRVEELAITQRADVLLSCPEPGRVEVATPSLARPWLPTRHPELDSPGPALLGATPLEFDLKTSSGAEVGLITRGAGLAARGFYTIAALHFERAIASDDTFSSARDARALPLAQIIALDAPEQAARIAFMATRQAWRRDEVLGQNMVMITAWNALGMRTAVQRIESSLPERVQRQPESKLVGWTTWRGLTQEIEGKNLRTLSEIKSASRSFPETDPRTPAWKLMLGLSLLLSDSPPRDEELDTLRDALLMQSRELDVEEAILTILGKVADSVICTLDGKDVSCLPDVYGRYIRGRETAGSTDALLATPPRVPYLVDHGKWKSISETERKRVGRRLVMAFLRSRAPEWSASEIAEFYGMQLAQQREIDLATIDHLRTHMTHRDTRSNDRSEMLVMLIDGMHAWLDGDANTAHERFLSHMRDAQNTYPGEAFTFWYHALLGGKESDSVTRARIEALLSTLNDEMPAVMCTRVHSAHALTHLKENHTDKAIGAFSALKQCDLEELVPYEKIEIEMVYAIIVRQHQGSLPRSSRKTLRPLLDELEAKRPRQTCHEAWADELPLETLLSQPLRGIAERFALDEEAVAKQSSFVAMNAASRRALVRAEMSEAHALFVAGEDDEALEVLGRALETARDARAWHLVRQLEYARAVFSSLSRPEQSIVARAELARTAKKDGLTTQELAHLELVMAFLAREERVQRDRLAAIASPHAWLEVLCGGGKEDGGEATR